MMPIKSCAECKFNTLFCADSSLTFEKMAYCIKGEFVIRTWNFLHDMIDLDNHPPPRECPFRNK